VLIMFSAVSTRQTDEENSHATAHTHSTCIAQSYRVKILLPRMKVLPNRNSSVLHAIKHDRFQVRNLPFSARRLCNALRDSHRSLRSRTYGNRTRNTNRLVGRDFVRIDLSTRARRQYISPSF